MSHVNLTACKIQIQKIKCYFAIDGNRGSIFIFDKQSKIQFLIDSGADVSIIPASIYRKTKQPDTYKLFAANNTTINTYGIQIISVDLGLRRQFDWEFLVADVSKASELIFCQNSV